MVTKDPLFGFQINFLSWSKPTELTKSPSFCPESAKIYADRVVENVPILAERVSGVDMNSNIPLAPASSSSSSGPSSSSAPGPSDLPRSEEPLRLKDPAVPRLWVGRR